jgi:UDP-N-acetylmuramoyl-L-alanyl-D-glutamate--2,6-diaminopimelate ligase
MRLDQLVGVVDAVAVRGDPASVDITAVVHDSRAVRAGCLFCCVPGRVVDGHDFAEAAVAAGAGALLCARPLAVDAVQVQVDDVRAAMASIAAAFSGDPSRRLEVVGVTGTNGKTTTVHLLRSVLEATGRPTLVIGTLTGTRTTPEAPELQAQLAEAVARGTRAVAMEVSSHALAQHRVDATWFTVAVFTNLSRDHLDFHPTMEDYFQTKARLFEEGRSATAVVNVDDPYGRLLRDAAVIPTDGYSLDEVDDLELGIASSSFRWRGERIHLGLGGRFNVSNALGAAHAAMALGATPDLIAAGLGAAGPVPGRFEPVDEGQPFDVVVDYAHTPDGLERVLDAAREIASAGERRGRVIVVFGCGGDRDATKRPAMGEVAARLANRVVLTSDNPRREDPGAIIDAVLAGIPSGTDLVVDPDRRAAIAVAIADAEAADIVVIAGKGHETTQTIGDEVVPFDDRVVAAEVLRSRSW